MGRMLPALRERYDDAVCSAALRTLHPPNHPPPPSRLTQVMLNARDVAFPAKPAVSAEAKDFIRRCLAYRQDDRMDVHAAAAHPYMSFKKPVKSTATAAAAPAVPTALGGGGLAASGAP